MTNPENPCKGCFLGKDHESGIQELNEMLNQSVSRASEAPAAYELTTHERHLGDFGRFIDDKAESLVCEGPTFSVKIGRISLLSVCRQYWEAGDKVTAILQSVVPTILKK